MDTKKAEKFLRDFGLYIVLILAGVILAACPDSATALITRLIGWFLVIAGAASLIRPTLRKFPIALFDWIRHGLAIIMGVLLIANPLVLSRGIGLFFGLLLLMEGIRNLKRFGLRLMPALTCAAGILLVLFPRALTQTLFRTGGIVLIVIGVVSILSKRNSRRLEKGNDPNIIDADM